MDRATWKRIKARLAAREAEGLLPAGTYERGGVTLTTSAPMTEAELETAAARYGVVRKPPSGAQFPFESIDVSIDGKRFPAVLEGLSK